MKKENKIGTYRKNQKGFGFVKIDEQEEEIYIARENSLNALNGDTVSIEILQEANREKDKKAEGKIVKIIRHEKDTVVGTFQKNRVKSRRNPVFSRVWGLFINDNFSPDGVEKSVAFATLSHL